MFCDTTLLEQDDREPSCRLGLLRELRGTSEEEMEDLEEWTSWDSWCSWWTVGAWVADFTLPAII